MTTRDTLKSLLVGKASLVSNGRTNGTSYTDAERELTKETAAAVCLATDLVEIPSAVAESIPDEVIEALSAAAEEAGAQASVPGLCRATYRAVEKIRLEDPDTIDDFPKMKDGERVSRDHTSVGLLFRKALEKLGVDKETIDTAFPSPYKKKAV